MNLKLRLKNKTTLLTLLVAGITFAYSVLSALGITPSITQEQAGNLAITAVSLLCALGIVVDPTTAGIADSERAMGYDEPKED